MFDFFKRLVAPAAKSAPQPTQRRPTSANARSVEDPPAPVPKVVEGNDHSDWQLWQDSVDALDSQMQPLALRSARTTVQHRQTPSQSADIDPFFRVSKNSDL